MPTGQERFDLDACLNSLREGLSAVVCHVAFDAAVHGLMFAAMLGLIGLVLSRQGHRFGRPLIAVCRKLSVVCVVLALPGGIAYAVSGHLPSTGSFQISSLGLIVFWTLISLHMSAEEMNFQWFSGPSGH